MVEYVYNMLTHVAAFCVIAEAASMHDRYRAYAHLRKLNLDLSADRATVQLAYYSDGRLKDSAPRVDSTGIALAVQQIGHSTSEQLSWISELLERDGDVLFGDAALPELQYAWVKKALSGQGRPNE